MSFSCPVSDVCFDMRQISFAEMTACLPYEEEPETKLRSRHLDLVMDLFHCNCLQLLGCKAEEIIFKCQKKMIEGHLVPFSMELDGGYLYNQVSCHSLGMDSNFLQFSVCIINEPVL